MKFFKSIVISFVLFSWLCCEAQTKSFNCVIQNISIVDVQNSKVIPGQTIYINEGKILKISKSNKNKKITSDTIIDGSGKYIIPGLWDMHIHVCWKENLDELFPTLLNYGITGVRDMGGDLKILNQFKNQITSNPETGPTLFGAGPILDGPEPVHPDFSMALTESNVRSVLDSLYLEKIDFLKVYSLLPKPVFDSVVVFATDKKIPFAGHVSEYLTPEEASSLGQKSFEHLNRLEELIDDTSRLSTFIDLAKTHHTWLCPTLIIYQRKAEFAKNEFYTHALYSELDSQMKVEWQRIKKKWELKALTEAEITLSQQRFENQKKLVKTFYDNGLPLLIGTDFAGMQFIYPGYSLHEEMVLLQSMGIPPYAILKMATLNSALYLGIDDLYGTVEVNKMADLIILNEDPMIDIGNALKIHTVLKAGQIVSGR